MYIKHNENGVISCTKSDDGKVITPLPNASDLPFDEDVPWEHTDKHYIRLPDYSAFVTDDSVEYLAVLKATKIDGLSAAFGQRVKGSITTTQGYIMQFDTSDSLKMQGAIQLLEATGQTEGYLTQANDETEYNVPLDTMKAVLIEMMTAFASCHARKQELRAQINAAQTKEDLDAVVISWPV